MVEPNRNTARGNEDRDPIAHDDRPRVIDFKSPPAVKFHGEDVERLELNQFLQDSIKVVSRHRDFLKATIVVRPHQNITTTKFAEQSSFLAFERKNFPAVAGLGIERIGGRNGLWVVAGLDSQP